MKIIVDMKFGSHMYGTDTPESDLDFKGVYLPTKRDAYLGKIQAHVRMNKKLSDGTKNSPGDVDKEFLSLQEFVRLAIEGQTMAIDMLNASSDLWTTRSDIWRELVGNRHRFYTKNLKAFVGYAQRQAAKYGIKGSRLATCKDMLNWLKDGGDRTVGDWFSMNARPLAWEHVSPSSDPTIRLTCLGKSLTSGAKCSHYVPAFSKYLESYGHRAKLAESSEGVDWKAMSHAIRAATEVNFILSDRLWSLPFPEEIASMLRKIKQGHYKFQDVQEWLEDAISECQLLSEKSTLPEVADVEWAQNFIHRHMKESADEV